MNNRCIMTTVGLCVLMCIAVVTACPASTREQLHVPVPTFDAQEGVVWSTTPSFFLAPFVGDNRVTNFETTPHPEVVTLIVNVHGSSRDPHAMFCAAYDGAVDFGLNPDSEVMIVAPFFQEDLDSPPVGEVFWVQSDLVPGDDWREGGNTNATSPTPVPGTQLSSYSILDWLLELAQHEVLFPNLERLVVTGHSAGGQVTQRWGMVSWILVHRQTPLRVKPISAPANPSTYAYLTNTRPNNLPAFPDSVPPTNYSYDYTFTFSVPSGTGCDTSYDRWKYGLDRLDRTPYVSVLTKENIQNAYRNAWQIVFLGELDTCNEDLNCCPVSCADNGLAKGCESMQQGHMRVVRGLAFYGHVKEFYGSDVHSPGFVIVPGEAHSTNGIYKRGVDSRRAMYGFVLGDTCVNAWQCGPGLECVQGLCENSTVSGASTGGEQNGASTGDSTNDDANNEEGGALDALDRQLASWNLPGETMWTRVGIFAGGVVVVLVSLCCIGYNVYKCKKKKKGSAWETGEELDSFASYL